MKTLDLSMGKHGFNLQQFESNLIIHVRTYHGRRILKFHNSTIKDLEYVK